MLNTSYTQCNTGDALARAITEELDRAGESPLHGAIHVSCKAAFLRNGIKHCSVQIECEAGCGYLVEAFGEEADLLQEKAIATQNLLHEGSKSSRVR